MKEPQLYGITRSNRRNNDLWGKNQFNSTFPASLACYMRDKKIPAIYLKLDSNLKVRCQEIDLDEVFNTSVANSLITFNFESKFEPYEEYSYQDISVIDLVLKDGNKWLRPLEVKLTVIPDNSTCNESQEKWGSELVIRPATTRYCALGIWDSCKDISEKVRAIFELVCQKVKHWNSKIEIYDNQEALLNALNEFQKMAYSRQKPFLLQPIWKTKGKSPILHDNAFDVFVWSDFALCRTFLDRSLSHKRNEVNRYMRASARLAKIFEELSTRGKADIEHIYTNMTYGLQSDKEFALNGKVTRTYMNSPRRANPQLAPKVLKEIILGEGQKLLSPERRFDQTIYYMTEHLFGEM